MTPTAAAPWKNRIVGSGEEAPDQLLANPANWRVHPKVQQQALAGILGQVGWVQQVLVNRRTGHVVDGHLRVALAILFKGSFRCPYCNEPTAMEVRDRTQYSSYSGG